MKNKFNVGDFIICVRNEYSPGYLTIDKKYCVLSTNLGNKIPFLGVKIIDDKGVINVYDINRFKLDLVSNRNELIDYILR